MIHRSVVQDSITVSEIVTHGNHDMVYKIMIVVMNNVVEHFFYFLPSIVSLKSSVSDHWIIITVDLIILEALRPGVMIVHFS